MGSARIQPGLVCSIQGKLLYPLPTETHFVGVFLFVLIWGFLGAGLLLFGANLAALKDYS